MLCYLPSYGELVIYPLSGPVTVLRALCRAFGMSQLRHTRITEIARKGFSQAQIMMVSGHRDVRSVQRCTHLNVKDVIDLLD